MLLKRKTILAAVSSSPSTAARNSIWMNAFDAHNHVHLSIPGGVPPLTFDNKKHPCATSDENLAKIKSHADVVVKYLSPESACKIEKEDSNSNGLLSITVEGNALMSTQPRDFPIVDEICKAMDEKLAIVGKDIDEDSDDQDFTNAYSTSVRCYGVHPWFLHVADDDFQHVSIDNLNGNDDDLCYSKKIAVEASLNWFPYLRSKLLSNPKACVGEVGLDGARYDPITRKTPSSMERQLQAFEAQIHLAAELRRPVSIHAVKAWGQLSDAFRRVKKERQKIVGKNKKERIERRRKLEAQGKSVAEATLLLPPKIYFHAFGGKAPIVDQLDSLCKGISETYYGFAPAVNFRSPKTSEVIRKIGISQLVLETDLEDYTGLTQDLGLCAQYLADALNLETEEVLEKTSQNAKRLYDIIN